MSTGLLIFLIIIVAVLVVAAVLVARQRRTQQLQERFGPEYERVVAREGDRRAAESQLSEREKRRRELDIVELDPTARRRYLEAWTATQGKFVDDPAGTTREADTLVATVMRERGYPVDDFDRRADDISVDHPKVAEDYRAAHAVSQANERGLATTDDLRQAFVHYRSLFVELLEPDGGAHTTDRDVPVTDDDVDVTDRDVRATDDDADVTDRDVHVTDGDGRERRPADGAA